MTTKYCSSHYVPSLQKILDLCIPENKLAKTRSQISFIYFQSHSWYSVRNYVIPKELRKTRLVPRLPRMKSWKSNKHQTLNLNTGPLLPLAHQSWYIISPQSCPSQDPSWGNKSAKPVKVTGKNDSPWLFWTNIFLNWTYISLWKFICEILWLIPFGIMYSFQVDRCIFKIFIPTCEK
jgi:hypothetical protein